jgi:hypothetical protein
MADLSPEARELVRVANEAYRPREVDRARVLDALRAALGDAVAQVDDSLGSARGSSGFWSRASGITVVGLLIVAGGVLSLALRTKPGRCTALPGMASSIGGSTALPSSAAAAASAPSVPDRQSVAPPVSRSSMARPTPPRRARDGLSEEVAILSRAETDLYGGRPASALTALDEHEHKFGNGVLAEERTAARIQALCALGRTADADAQLARLARVWPTSPHAERARQACALRRSR